MSKSSSLHHTLYEKELSDKYHEAKSNICMINQFVIIDFNLINLIKMIIILSLISYFFISKLVDITFIPRFLLIWYLVMLTSCVRCYVFISRDNCLWNGGLIEKQIYNGVLIVSSGN